MSIERFRPVRLILIRGAMLLVLLMLLMLAMVLASTMFILARLMVVVFVITSHDEGTGSE